MKSTKYMIALFILLHILIFGLPTHVTTAQDNQLQGIVYIRSDSEILALNVDTKMIELIANYDIFLTSSGKGWVTAKFSNQSQYIAYLRVEDSHYWLGVSPLSSWMVQELELTLVNFEPTEVVATLTWLPSDKYLILSFRENDTFELLERYMLNMETMILEPFPFKLHAVGTIVENGNMGLSWIYNEALDTAEQSPETLLIYDLLNGLLLHNTEITDDLLIGDIDEFDWDWDWSEEFGFVYYDISSAGYFWLENGANQTVRLTLETIWNDMMMWSPDAPYILVQDHANSWSVFDAMSNELLYNLTIPQHSYIRWFHDHRTLIYVDSEDQIIYRNREIKLLTLETSTEYSLYTLDTLIYEIAVVLDIFE